MSMEHRHHAHSHDEHKHSSHHHVHDKHEELPCDGEGHKHHHHDNGDCCCHYHEILHHRPNYFKLARIAISIVLFVSGHFLHGLEFYFMLVAAVVSGYDIAYKAVVSIFKGKIFSEYFLMTVAAIAAFIIGESHEAAGVLVLYRVGEFFQECALRYSRRKIIQNRPDKAEDICTPGSAEQFITRFSRIYTPVVLILAVLMGALGPVIGFVDSYSEAVYGALTLLVIACPCAIVISVPMAYSAGIAAGARKKVYFAEAPMIDSLAKTKPGEVYEMKVALKNREGVLVSTRRYADVSTAEALVIDDEGGCAFFARKIARKVKIIALENIWFVIAIKIAVLVMAICGVSSLWFAVFADSGVSILTVLNSLRAFLVRKKVSK